MTQLGRAFSIMQRGLARELAMHADVDAFYAPSECHAVVARGGDQRLRQARRHARSVSGLSRRQFRLAWGRLHQRHRDRLLDACLDQMLPH